MSFEKAKEYLEKYNLEDRIQVFETSSATVELAAKAVGCEGKQIAKSMTFLVDDNPVMVIAAGDTKVDNSKFKAFFATKAKMLTPQQVDDMIGHSIGGVCPFGINDGVKVYLDEMLKRFDYVYPACGSSNSAVKLTVEELEQISQSIAFIDVCKLM